MKSVINTEYARARRKELNLTQQDVATALGLKSKSHYCKLERGIHRLYVHQLIALSLTLDCDISQLIKEV